MGRSGEAAACFRRAIELEPACADFHYNQGIALCDLDQLDEAVAAFEQAIRLSPRNDEYHYSLGHAMWRQGRLEEATRSWREALCLEPHAVGAHSNLLHAMQCDPDVTLERLAVAHADYERQRAAPLRAAWRPHDNFRDPDRRLRVGLLSADLGQHPVAHLIVRPIELLDRSQCELVCYSDRRAVDDVTRRFMTCAAVWREVAGESDERLAEQIRDDRIDILFDLGGHTACNRLLVFARKPAPIQITWLGYVGTTGLKAIDYILGDEREIPSGAETYYAEQALRMPDGYVCFEPPSHGPAVSPLPARERGFVTFGSFNGPAKLNGRVIEVWSQILRRLPDSRLVLKYRGLESATASRRIRAMFTEVGIGPERLTILGGGSRLELLAEYQHIDIGLDPFPYSGCMTTCEASWMGVPVITCPGETFASRQSLSHLSNIGFTETIATDLDHYVELAARLAEDLPRLAQIRAGLRDRMARSPLCDGPRFAANLMKLLREVWRDWCVRSKGTGTTST